MSTINFRLYGEQIYGLGLSKIKDLITPEIDKESFITMFKEGQVKYENIQSKQKISVHPQISINDLKIENLFLNIPNETENFSMNLSGVKTTIELFELSESEAEKIIIEKRKTLVENFIGYAVKKIENKESSKSFIEGLLENLINRAINGLKIELNNIELQIKYKNNIFSFFIESISYSEENGIKIKNFSFLYELGENSQLKNYIIKQFNIEIEIKKAENDTNNNELNIKLSDFQFEFTKNVFSAFNEIFNLIDNTKYKYIYVRNKQLIQYFKPKKPENDNIEEKNKYYNLLWLYAIKTVIKLQKYIGYDKLYILDLPKFIQEKISKKYVDNNNEIEKLIIPTKINLLKATKLKVENKVLDGKKGNVLSNAFSFFFGGKKDDEEEKKELSEEEKNIFENLYEDNNLIQYLYGKKDEKNNSNPMKEKIMGFVSKLAININFNKLELILSNDDINKCTLFVSNIRLNIEKKNDDINTVLNLGNIGSNLDENLFSDRIKINDNNDVIMVSKDKNNKIKIDLGFKNIELGEEIFNFLLIFFSSIKFHKKNKIFKEIKYDIKAENEEKKEEIKSNEQQQNDEQQQKDEENKNIEGDNIGTGKEIFKNISISSIPSLVISNHGNKTFFSIVNYSITSSKIEITYNIKDSFGTILDNYIFVFNKDIQNNKYSLNLESPLRITLQNESSKLLFISFLKVKERLNQIKKRNKNIQNISNINNENADNEQKKELYNFNYVIHKKIDISNYNMNDLQIEILLEKIIIEIYENNVKSKFSIHNFNVTYENKNLEVKIGKISVKTNLMSTMIIYLADFESPNFAEFQKYIDSIQREYLENKEINIIKEEKKDENKNEGNIKYDINIDNVLNSVKVFINSLIYSFQANDNIISYAFNKIRIQKKEDNISIKLSTVNLTFRKEENNFNNIKIFNIEEETSISFNPQKNLAIVRISDPKLNIDVETMRNIRKSFQYLLEQVDWEIILCKVDLQVLNAVIKINNEFNIYLKELLLKNFDGKNDDTIYLTINNLEVKNKNNKFITGQKALNLNIIMKSIVDYYFILNFTDLNINLSKTDINNLSNILSNKEKNDIDEIEGKHYVPSSSNQKESHEYNFNFEGNLPLVDFLICADTEERNKKCELIISPLEIKTKIFIPAKLKDNNDIEKNIDVIIDNINLVFNNDNNEEYNIIEYNGKEGCICDYDFDQKSLINFEPNVNSKRKQIELNLNNKNNKFINDININLNKFGLNTKLDIILCLLKYIKDIIPNNILENKENKNKDIEKGNKRESEIHLNLNLTDIQVKFESMKNKLEEIYLNINEINYIFRTVEDRKIPFGYNEIKLDKIYLTLINNEEINKILNTQSHFITIKADTNEIISKIDIFLNELFINLSFTDIKTLKNMISSNIAYIKNNKIYLLIDNSKESSQIQNKKRTLTLNYNMKSIDLKLIDNNSNNYQPFLNLKLNNISSYLNEKKIINSSLYISLETYNYIACIWEPVIENSCLKLIFLRKKDNNNFATNIIKFEIYQLSLNVSDMFIGSTVLSMNNLKKILDENKTLNKSSESIVRRPRISFSMNSVLSNSLMKDISINEGGNASHKNQTNNKIINLTGKEFKIIFNNKKYDCSPGNDTELEYINNIDKNKNKLKLYYNKNNLIDISFNVLGIDSYKLNNGQYLIWENIVSEDRHINIIVYSEFIFKNKTNYTFQIKLMNKDLGNKYILLRPMSKSGIPLDFCNNNTSYIFRIYDKKSDNGVFNENNKFNLGDVINCSKNENYEKKLNFKNKSLLLKLQNKINKVNTLLITSEYSIINCLPCDILVETKNKNEKIKIKKCSQFLIDFNSDEELDMKLIIKIAEDYFYSENIKFNILIKNKEKNSIIFRNKKGEYFNLSFLIKNKNYHKSLIIYTEYILYNDTGIDFKFNSNILFNIAKNIYLISNKIDLEQSNFELSNKIFNSISVNLEEMAKASPFYQLELNNGDNNLIFPIKKKLSFISIRNNPNFRENIISMIFDILPICKITNLFSNKKLVLRDKNDKSEPLIIPPLNQVSFNFFNKSRNNCMLELGLINAKENHCEESCLFNKFKYGIYTLCIKDNFFNLEIRDSATDGILNIFVTETNLQNAKIVVFNKTKINFEIYQNNYDKYKQIIRENSTQILKIYNQNNTIIYAEIKGKKYDINFNSFKEEFNICQIGDEFILVKESNGIKMKITLYNKSEFDKLNKDVKNLYNLYTNIFINNCYISIIGDNFNKNRKLRNYERNEILLVYLNGFNTEININKNKDIIANKNNIELKCSLPKLEIFNQLSKKGKYSCIFKNINSPCMNISLKADIYNEDQVAKINNFNYNINRLKLNVDPEFILQIINFVDNIAFRIGKINFNVDKIFLRTNANILDIKIKKNLEKYKSNQKLICYGSEFNFPPISIDYELTEVNLEQLLRDKVGCTDLFVWLGFGLVRQNQNLYLEKFKIIQYLGDIPGLFLKVQNNYKSQMSSVIRNMGLKGFIGQIRQFFVKERTDENSIDVQKNRIRYPRAFYGKYNYIKKYNEEEAIIIDKIISMHLNDFKEIYCNDILQSKNFIFYFSGSSLFIFTKNYELYYKIEYKSIQDIYNEEENLIINYRNDNDEENPPSIINCDEVHNAKNIIKFLDVYR